MHRLKAVTWMPWQAGYCLRAYQPAPRTHQQQCHQLASLSTSGLLRSEQCMAVLLASGRHDSIAQVRARLHLEKSLLRAPKVKESAPGALTTVQKQSSIIPDLQACHLLPHKTAHRPISKIL